jgi:hypothetical protein
MELLRLHVIRVHNETCYFSLLLFLLLLTMMLTTYNRLQFFSHVRYSHGREPEIKELTRKKMEAELSSKH